MRPVASLRWEATRVKAGSFSTSAKRSRTKGRSMQEYFSRSGRRPRCARRTGEGARSHTFGARAPVPTRFVPALGPEEGAGEAGRAAAAVDAEFGGGEGAEVESGLAEASAGFGIFGDGEEAVVSQGQDVAGQRVAFGRVDLDEFESAGAEQFNGFDGEPGEIDESGPVVEQAD